MPSCVFRRERFAMSHARAFRTSARTSRPGYGSDHSVTWAAVTPYSCAPLPTHGSTATTGERSGGGGGDAGGLGAVVSPPPAFGDRSAGGGAEFTSAQASSGLGWAGLGALAAPGRSHCTRTCDRNAGACLDFLSHREVAAALPAVALATASSRSISSRLLVSLPSRSG